MLREEQFRLVLIMGMLLFLFFVCLSLLLLAIRVYLSGDIQAQQILLDSQKQQGGELRIAQIRQANADVTGILAFYKTSVSISEVVAHVSRALPEGIFITSFQYTPVESSKAKIALQGFALRVEDLLEFRTNLEKDSLFHNFHFPVASLFEQPSNINFSFDFEL